MRNATRAAVLAVLVAIPVRVQAEGSLATARELYTSAAYDDALAMLDGLMPSAPVVEERQSIDLYRALCLVALGRSSDADRAIEAIVQRDPQYRASVDDLSPRVRSAFSDARRRLLPSVIQRQYLAAKTAFDAKEFAAAAAGFEGVLAAIADPDLAPLAGVPPLSDLRTLAVGFKDLSVSFTPPPAPTAPAPVVPARTMYSDGDAGVIAPVAVQQKMPRFPAAVVKPLTGLVEMVINEKGAVESRTMRVSIDPMFDRMVLSAAEKWRYRPATIDSVPVKFLKRISITVAPPPP